MIQIRACNGLEELEACVQLQIETWGYEKSEVIPRKLFLVVQKIGGQVVGAFDSEASGGSAANPAGKLVGFAMSLPGAKTAEGEPRAYLHSHLLAVDEQYRNQGLGAQLKWEQRHEALSRGIVHMEWTFDPLAMKNGFLNIHKLGATASEYHVDFYGVSSSRLQGGLPTDRLLARWELDSQRVEGILAQRPTPSYTIEERILIPASVDQWKANEATRERALAVLLENRKKFLLAFSQGLAVLGFSRDAQGNGVFELGRLSQA